MNEQETVKERLTKYLREKGIGRNRFESMAGISAGYITNLKKAPGADILVKILNAAPDLNKSWLLTGEGEMLKTQVITGDNNVQVGGNASNVNAGGALCMALAEIAKAHDLMDKMQSESVRRTAKMQEQMDRLISIIENHQNYKKSADE